ncbi:MAG: hypothetical protein V4726_13780 [Verrucomicrobiota bacterium]
MSGNRLLSKQRLPLLLMCLTGAVAGTGLGLLGRRVLAKTHGAASAGQTSAASEIQSGNLVHQGNPSLPAGSGKAGAEAKAETITTALARDKGLDYWLHLLAAADGSPAEVLARLIDSVKDEPVALSLLGARWAQLDPVGMFAALKARVPKSRYSSPDSTPEDELQGILVNEWFRQDPAALIEALDGTAGVEEWRNCGVPKRCSSSFWARRIRSRL